MIANLYVKDGKENVLANWPLNEGYGNVLHDISSSKMETIIKDFDTLAEWRWIYLKR